MKLSTICLGVLLPNPRTGYEIQRIINTSLGHFQHASFGALYPALGALEAEKSVRSERAGSTGLGKRLYEITALGRETFQNRLREASGGEELRSDFLAAMYFCEQLSLDDITRLIDERLYRQRQERRELLALPLASMSDGQRLTVRYALAMKSAAIDFLQGEGRAIETAIQRERYQ